MTTHEVAGHKYSPKSDHRDGTAKKSQWTVAVAAEIESFRLAVAEGWTNGALAWSLHIHNGRADYLGTSAKDPGPDEPLFLALFEIAATCHGFPADHRRSNREKPPAHVQRAWLASPVIRDAVVRKIGRGQRCSL